MHRDSMLSAAAAMSIPPIGFASGGGSRNVQMMAVPASNHNNHSDSLSYPIHVLFLQPVQGDRQEHLLNRLTSFLGQKVHSRGFHHTEIVIPDVESHSSSSFLSSSIYNGETVYLASTKTFANPGYTVTTFTVTGKELNGIRNYLQESKRMQLGFDAIGMYLAALPFQLGPRSERSTFCSKHVTCALKAGGIEAVQDLNENIVTPSKLYRVLQERIPSSRKLAGSVAFKQQSMLQNARLPVFSIEE